MEKNFHLPKLQYKYTIFLPFLCKFQAIRLFLDDLKAPNQSRLQTKTGFLFIAPTSVFLSEVLLWNALEFAT